MFLILGMTPLFSVGYYISDGIRYIPIDTKIGEKGELPVSIHILEIDPSKTRMELVSAEGKGETVAKMARERGATAAINGTYWRVEEGRARPNYLRKIHDEILNVKEGFAQGGNPNKSHDSFAWNKDKVALGAVQKEWLKVFTYIIGGDLMLVRGGKLEKTGHHPDFVKVRHPRTAIGLRNDDGRLFFVVVDGYSKESAGMNFDDLQDLMSGLLKCDDAYTVCGGASSTMYIRDIWDEEERVANYPHREPNDEESLEINPKGFPAAGSILLF